MTQLYRISHSSLSKPGIPEIRKIIHGIKEYPTCGQCGVKKREPIGDLYVNIGNNIIKKWPDVIACGDYPCFVVSRHFVEAMTSCSIILHIGGEVHFSDTINYDNNKIPPQYFWIDGRKHLAAEMDFQSSGFVDAKICSNCGVFSANIRETHKRRTEYPIIGDVFIYKQELGLDIFTTNLSPTWYYCTKGAFDCCKTNKITNLLFSKSEEGELGKAINY